jgi:cardiolipin synthase
MSTTEAIAPDVVDTMTFYTKREYFDELNRRFAAATAGTRILLMSMNFDPDIPEIAEVMTNLEGAAQRGADVSFGVDALDFILPNGRPGPLFYHTELPAELSPPMQRRRSILEQLNSHDNARAVILNQPSHRFSLPVAGRSHIKAAIIGNYLMVGGCNLDDPEYIDMMVGREDASGSDKLYRMLRSVLEAGSARKALGDTDQTIVLDEATSLLLDAGVPGQSLILDESLKLIDTAEKWLTITCQFFPNSVTARHLLQARNRDVALSILYGHLRHQGFIGGTGQLVSQLIERCRLPADMFKDGLARSQPKLHAKLIACEKGLMKGSHNYVRAGVRLGTAELTLRSSNAKLAVQARSFIEAAIQKSSGPHRNSNPSQQG